MLTNIKKSLALCKMVAEKVNTDDVPELESLKSGLSERMGNPVGWHMTGIPLVLSMALTVICFAMPQASLWISISRWLSWPPHSFFIGLLITNLVFCALFIPMMTLILRGYYWSLKLYLALFSLAAVVTIIYFITIMIRVLTGAEYDSWLLTSSILGLIFIATSIKCLNSNMFVRTMTLGLHNRVLRKLLRLQKQTLTAMKR